MTVKVENLNGWLQPAKEALEDRGILACPSGAPQKSPVHLTDPGDYRDMGGVADESVTVFCSRPGDPWSVCWLAVG